MFLRQSTSQIVLFGPFLDPGDAVTEEVALTITQALMRLSKDGGAFAQKSAAGNATHDSDGWYATTLSTTDTATVGELVMNVQDPSNTLPVWMRWWVIEEAVYDAIYGASAEGPLQATTAGRTLDILSTGEGAANLTMINGVAQTATLDDIEAQTDDIGVAGAGLTAIPWNSAWDTEVESECNDALVALNLDHLMAVAVVGTDVVDNSVFAKIASSAATADWDTFVNTDDSLQAISEGGGGGPTAADIADAVWDEAQVDHVAVGSFGEMATEIAAILIDTGEIGTAGVGLSNIPWNSSWDTEVESECNDALVALGLDHLIAVALPTSWAADVTADSVLDYMADDGTAVFDRTTDSLQAISDGGGGGPTAADIADAVWDEAQADHVAAGSFGEIATEIAAILIDTAEIGTAGAGLSNIPWNAAWDTEIESEVTDALVAFFTSSAQLVDDIWDEILTGATHNIVDSAARRLRDLQEFGIYEGGAIWIDTVNGAAGTTDYESGTVFNPVNTLADANTLATSLGLSRFRVAPGSSITFVAAQQSQDFFGFGWTLALGGQDIANTTIRGANVSGVSLGTGTQFFIDCEIGAVTLPATTHLEGCAIEGTQTLLAGDYFYDRCHSAIAGTATPVWDFTVGALNTNLNIRNYSGGVDLRNMGQAGTDKTSLEGRGQVIVNANCTGGTIVIRGLFELSDSGAATITDGARWNQSQILSDATPFQGADIALILTDTGEIGAAGAGLSAIPWNAAWDTEVESECNDALVALGLDHLLAAAVVGADVTDDSIVAFLVSKEATTDWDDFVNTTDSLQALSDRLPAALLSGLMSSDVTAISTSTDAADKLEASTETMVIGTVDDSAFAMTTTEFEADDITEATPDHYNGRIIIWLDPALQEQATKITDYALAGANGHFTVDALTEAPANDDQFIII